MVDLKICEWVRPSYAFLRWDDLEQDIDQIYLGDMSSCPEDTGFVIKNIESIITHESIHIAIYKLTRLMRITRLFDNIDNCYDRENKESMFIYSRPLHVQVNEID